MSTLRSDVIAGLATAAVVIPKAMAYATVAGLPVQVGIYTVFTPMVLYALLGSSRVLSVSTTTTLAILAGASLAGTGPRANATLTFLVGIVLVAAGLMRLGFVANFISEPVLVGFKSGIGLVIVVDQIPKLLGIHADKGPFGHSLLEILRGLPQISVPTLLVGAMTIGILVALEHLTPRLPAPLVAVAAAIGAMSFFHLQNLGVQTVGDVPRGLPSFTLPDPALVSSLWAGAVGIALMSFTETIAAGRAFAGPGEPHPRANRELLATGIANAGGALLGSMPAGGGTTQTAVNRLAGARTQAAALVTAGGTLITMLLLAPLVSRMPQATLAAVVIVYSIGLVRPDEFAAILRIRRMEFSWALAALTGVVVLGTLKGIVVAIVVSLVSLAALAANPPLYVLVRKRGTNVFRPRSPEHPDDESFPGLLLLRPEGRVFFANASALASRVKALVEAEKPRVLALDLSAVPDLEYTALKMLTEAEAHARARGIELWLVSLTPETLALVKRSPLGERLGRERMHFDCEVAVARYLGLTAGRS